MSAPTSNEVDRLASLPKPSLENRIWLRDLPTPPELVPVIEEYCRRFWFWERAAQRRSVAERYKLQWYFGGHHVSFLVTPHGYAVLKLDDVSEGSTHRLRVQLPVEERDQLRNWFIEKWNDAEPLLTIRYYMES